MTLRNLSVAAKESPFEGRVHTKQIEASARNPTIAEILAGIDGLPEGYETYCEARINGEEIERKNWAKVRPLSKPDHDIAITFTVPMRGGGGGGGSSGGGGKSALSTIATIAVLLVAAAVSGGTLLPAVGFLSAGAVSAIGGAAIGIGGALAIAALTPPPSTTPISGSTSSSPTAPSPLAASLTGNVLAEGAPIPRVVGTMRVFPPLACPPLVEVIGDQEYAETVMVLAGPHALSSVRVDGVDSVNIAELDLELQEGVSNAAQSLVSRYGQTLSPNLEVVGHLTDPTTQYVLQSQSNPDSSSPQWFDLITRDSPDEMWINLAWPAGLSNLAGNTVNQAVRVRFRLRGGSTWTNCPEIHFSQNQPVPFQKVIRLKWGTIPAAPNVVPSNKGPVYAFKKFPGQTATVVTPPYLADAYFSAGSGNDLLSATTQANGTSNVLNTELYQDKVIFYLNPATFPKGIYEIQVMRSHPYISNEFSSPSTYTFSAGAGVIAGAGVYDIFKYQFGNGVYQIQTNLANFQSRIVISRLSSVWNSNPIRNPDKFATISLRVHSRALDSVSVLASGYVNDWDGTDWRNLTTTSNPAPHYYDVLTGTLGGSPLPKDIVNSSEIVAWRSACISKGYTVNAVVEGKNYLEVADMIASCGYARRRNNETWGVFLDRDRSADTPIQVFTPRNMKNFGWTRAFAKKPTGIRAGFINASLDYLADENIVYADPDRSDGTNLEQILYEGLVNSADVTARANFDLKQLDLRLTFYNGETDLESLVCQRGDLVGVQHDVLSARAGFARIKSVTIVAGNVTGLVLEGTTPIATDEAWSSETSAWSSFSSAWLSARTGIAIRLKGGNGFLTKQITGASLETDTVTFSVPFADPGSSVLDTDCLCAIGPLGSEYKRLIVYSVTPDNQMNSKLVFVDEAPGLFS